MNRRRSVAAASLLLTLSAATASADDFRAWLLADAPQWMQDARPVTTVNDLGVGSAECLNCHDGVHASRITATHAVGSGIGSRLRGGNHPVGMDYASAASRHRSGYRPRSALPRSVVLENGRVTCLSCHRIAMLPPQARGGFVKVAAWSTELRPAPHSSELTVGPLTSDLCLACHRM